MVNRGHTRFTFFRLWYVEARNSARPSKVDRPRREGERENAGSERIKEKDEDEGEDEEGRTSSHLSSFTHGCARRVSRSRR